MGCEGVDGVEQGASMAAREAESDDEDEAMAGDENVPVKRAEWGGSSIGSIAKKKQQGQKAEQRATAEAVYGNDCSTTGG